MRNYRKQLINSIKLAEKNKKDFILVPNKNFTRNRIFTFSKTIWTTINLNQNTLHANLNDLHRSSSEDISGTDSAYIQARDKILPEAYRFILKDFTTNYVSRKITNNLRILAIDGSDVQVPTNSNDVQSYVKTTNYQKGYNIFHMNSMYDIKNGVFLDMIVQKYHNKNENSAFCQMVDELDVQPYTTIIEADRGYEAWNNLAHVEEKQQFYVIRIKNGKCGILSGLTIPNSIEFDKEISIDLCRGQTEDDKIRYKAKEHHRFLPQNITFDFLPKKREKNKPAQRYHLKFRVVRFIIGEDKVETIVTNLPAEKYSISKLKYLYGLRWSIETAYRFLKYTVGLVHLHCKSEVGIIQEFYSNIIIYNLTQMVLLELTPTKNRLKKYQYKVNFSIATHEIKKYLRKKQTLKQAINLISKDLIPIRPNRKNPRNKKARTFKGFTYKTA